MAEGTTAPTTARRRPPRRAWLGPLRAWREWLPPTLLALVGVVVTQEMDQWLLQRLPGIGGLILGGSLEAVVVVTPVLLYVLWRHAAQTQRAAYEQLLASESLRQDLANMLVHDLRNPLLATQMVLKRLNRMAEREGAMSADACHLVHAAADSLVRMERMIVDILEVARAESGEMPLNPQTTDVVAIVREAVAEATPYLHEGSVAIVEALEPAPLEAEVDTEKIRRVVDNLLANASKFTPPGGQVEVCVKRVGDDVQVTVRDSGVGVPEELRERIFDRFVQARARSERKRGSVGLGLSFARLAVEAHGGRIWVEGEGDQGASFTFALPLASGEHSGKASQGSG